MQRYTRAALLPFFALGIAVGCSKPAPPPPSPSPFAPPPTAAAALRVTDIELGRAVDMEKRISDKTDSFKPADTIYVSIATDGASPGARLEAHRTYQDGPLVKHDETSVAPSGKAYTEFHIAKPGGWPAGDYKVEVTLDGASAGAKSFRVEK
jgi:hypothetical protein